MQLLVIGLVIFIGIHLIPSLTNFRQTLIHRLGEKTYKVIFAVIAFTGLVLIIIGKGEASFSLVWSPPPWGRQATYLIMPFAFILLTAAYLPTNIKRFTRHPMLWAVTLWSVSHLLSNGDLASILLFVSIGLFALFDMISANMRGAKLTDEKVSIYRDLTVILIGIVTYVLVLLVHPAWSGFRMLR